MRAVGPMRGIFPLHFSACGAFRKPSGSRDRENAVRESRPVPTPSTDAGPPKGFGEGRASVAGVDGGARRRSGGLVDARAREESVIRRSSGDPVPGFSSRERGGISVRMCGAKKRCHRGRPAVSSVRAGRAGERGPNDVKEEGIVAVAVGSGGLSRLRTRVVGHRRARDRRRFGERRVASRRVGRAANGGRVRRAPFSEGESGGGRFFDGPQHFAGRRGRGSCERGMWAWGGT